MSEQVRDPQEWAARITESWRKSVESIIETGRQLREAKKAIPHGGWLRMFKGQPDAVEHPLPFDLRTAQRLMQIAANPILSNPAHAPHLPPVWMTLYDLSKLPPPALQAYVEGDKKAVWAHMQRADVAKLRRPHQQPPKGQTTIWMRNPDKIEEYVEQFIDSRSPTWTPAKAERRLRQVIEKEMWQAPQGQEAVIDEILRRIAAENETARQQLSELNEVGRQWLTSQRSQAAERVLAGRMIGGQERELLEMALEAQCKEPEPEGRDCRQCRNFIRADSQFIRVKVEVGGLEDGFWYWLHSECLDTFRAETVETILETEQAA